MEKRCMHWGAGKAQANVDVDVDRCRSRPKMGENMMNLMSDW